MTMVSTQAYLIFFGAVGILILAAIGLAVTSRRAKAGFYYVFDHIPLLLGFFSFLFLPGEVTRQLSQKREVAPDATQVHWSYGERGGEFELKENVINGTAYCPNDAPGITVTIDCNDYARFFSTQDEFLMPWNIGHALIVFACTVVVVLHMFQNTHEYGTIAFYQTILRQRKTKYFRWILYVLLGLASGESVVPFLLVAILRSTNPESNYDQIDLGYLFSELVVITGGAIIGVAVNLARIDDYYPEEFVANAKLRVPFHWRSGRVVAKVELAYMMYRLGRSDVLNSLLAEGKAYPNYPAAGRSALDTLYTTMADKAFDPSTLGVVTGNVVVAQECAPAVVTKNASGPFATVVDVSGFARQHNQV